MSHEPDEQPLPPADEARVRRLLADARETGPMPPDVVARLERTLADLATERADGPDAATPEQERGQVLPLASRTRRVRAAALLAGAAAVVVMGVGFGQLVESGDGQDAGGSAADGSVDRGDEAELAEPEAAAAAEDQSPAKAPGEDAGPGDALGSETVTTEEPPRTVRTRRLQADLTALQHAIVPGPARADYTGTTITQPEDFPCPPASWGTGVIVAVLYDEMPAMVAFRQPTGDSQVAEVLQCGTGDVLRSTTLPTSG